MTKLLLAVLFVVLQTAVFSQEPAAQNGSPVQKPTAPNQSRAEDKKGNPDISPPAADISKAPISYIRPDSKKRFKMYVNDVAGPVAIGVYLGTAGLLTARNSPKEWGAKVDGFAYRVANVAGKNFIRTTTADGLDRLLKLDSTFHPSRDRSVTARLRNSVFSSVTARNKNGKRVLGIPNIVGGTTAEVISSTVWYPSRYDYIHGLKGGAISIGINAGFNLFREFVWKR